MEKLTGYFWTLVPFVLRKLMIWFKCSPNNYFYLGLGLIEWIMVAYWLYEIGYYFGASSEKAEKNDVEKFKKQFLEEVRGCYSRFENEYVPLKEKMGVLKFELEKEQWRVKVLRQNLEALNEQESKKKRTPEQANKEAIHSVGGNA